MEKKYFAPSELIINEDGSAFHLHLKPEQVADKVILVGDPGRVETVASFFETRECEADNREFKSITVLTEASESPYFLRASDATTSIS